MGFNRFPTKRIAPATFLAMLAIAAAVAATGCGGGGGGGGGGNGGNGGALSFSGTVADESGNFVSGDIVTFDGISAYSATTNSSGAFTIKGVPKFKLTGSDYLLVADGSGADVADYSLANVSESESGIAITIGPPPPPSLAAKR